MELIDFFNKEIELFFQYNFENKNNNSNEKIRNEELGVYNIQKDYESLISKYMRNGDIGKAKSLFKELIDKSKNANKENKDKIMKILSKSKEIIKQDIKEYNDEIMLKNVFKEYDKVIEEHRAIPDKIKSESSNISFFDSEDNSNIQNQKILPESQLLDQNISNQTSNNNVNSNILEEMKKKGIDFKKAEIKYDEKNPTHIIKEYSEYKNGFIIFVESVKTKEPEIFKINTEPKQERIILTEV